MNHLIQTVSSQATRSHPWERWVEPEVKQARYFGVWVTVIQEFTQLALVRRPDGLAYIVDKADLSEVKP